MVPVTFLSVEFEAGSGFRLAGGSVGGGRLALALATVALPLLLLVG